ncbi:MAG: epimerase [Chitinophagales bacterium]
MKVIITGASGMVGEGVLHECLLSESVESILVIGRRACGTIYKKLKESIHSDFFNLSAIESEMRGYDACFFCLGVSSVGMNEVNYSRMTYDLTMNFARTVSAINPGMVFCYVSGAGTDSTEKGRSMWARVKGRTENDLMRLPFKKVYHFRPGIMKPTPGLKNTLGFYQWMGWLIPIIRLFAPNAIITLRQLGLAMIHVVQRGYPQNILEIKDIVALSI